MDKNVTAPPLSEDISVKRHIFVYTTALLAALVCSNWSSVVKAQGFTRSGRRAEWQSRVLQDINPTVMTPEAAFGDQPLLAEREWQLNPVPEQGGVIHEGTVILDQGPSILNPIAEGDIGSGYESGYESGYDDCTGCSDCTSCGDCSCECGSVCTESCGSCTNRVCCGLLFPRALSPLMQRTQFFGGVHAFKGPVDRGNNGNFGFHGGFNFSGPIGGPNVNGYQLGLNLVGSDYSGSSIMSDNGGDRKQLFFTGGIFHRALNGGMQAGIVYDFLQDTFYFGKAHLGQVRAEVSWGECGYQEVGFWGAFRTRSDDLTQTIGQVDYLWKIKPTSQYAFFYRRNFCEGAEARIWAGFTGDSDGLFGADLRIPLAKSLALENSFNYLIPKQGRGNQGAMEESWGLVMNLVWYPGRSAKSVACDPFRPFFNVGNNNSFMNDME